MTKKRKLGRSYISFDFVCIAKYDGAQKSNIFCDKFPANESMKSRKFFSEHLESTLHIIEFFIFLQKKLSF